MINHTDEFFSKSGRHREVRLFINGSSCLIATLYTSWVYEFSVEQA